MNKLPLYLRPLLDHKAHDTQQVNVDQCYSVYPGLFHLVGLRGPAPQVCFWFFVTRLLPALYYRLKALAPGFGALASKTGVIGSTTALALAPPLKVSP